MRRHRTRQNSLSMATQTDTVRVDRIMQDFFLRLSAANSSNAIGETLAGLGAQFRLPNLYLGHNRKTDDEWKRQRIFRSPKAPRALMRALAAHPMAQSASEARQPMTLTEYNMALAHTAWIPPASLEGIESLVINVETAPDTKVVAVFSGRGGTVNGLAKSLLTFGTNLAVRRLTLPIWPVVQPQGFSNREQQIVALAKEGLTDAEIGRKLALATRTIRYHFTKAMKRHGISSRAQLILKASREPSEFG